MFRLSGYSCLRQEYLRLGVKQRGCNGLSYTLNYAGVRAMHLLCMSSLGQLLGCCCVPIPLRWQRRDTRALVSPQRCMRVASLA